MDTIVFASKNQGKVKEINALVKDKQLEVLSLAQFPDCPEVEEDGETFEANAIKKAIEVAKYTGLVTMADDSGLVVDALNGEPGVYSARYAGEPKSDEANNAKLLSKLKDVPEKARTARFVTVIAIAKPDGAVKTVEGTCEGLIIDELRGESGFGYDPIFYVPELDKTFAQLDMSAKNQISHRGQALRKMLSIIPEFLDI